MKPYSPLEKQPWWNLKRVITTLAVVFMVICATALFTVIQEQAEAPTDHRFSITTWNVDRPLEDIPFVRDSEETYVPEEAEPWTGPSIFVLKNTAYLGMSTDTVRERCGPPNDINRTVGSWGVHEQWVYGSTVYWRVYLYFENGYLTSWQE